MNVSEETMSIVAVLLIVIGYVFWMSRPLRGKEPGYRYVYVNQDGSARELSPKEQAYTSEKFEGGDSGRPYIKSDYKSSDGWGSQSGFIPRRRVPANIPILAVNPNYDALEEEMGFDMLASNRAAGDIIEEKVDGPYTGTSVTPNPNISKEERFEIIRQYELAEQRRREALAKIS